MRKTLTASLLALAMGLSTLAAPTAFADEGSTKTTKTTKTTKSSKYDKTDKKTKTILTPTMNQKAPTRTMTAQMWFAAGRSQNLQRPL